MSDLGEEKDDTVWSGPRYVDGSLVDDTSRPIRKCATCIHDFWATTTICVAIIALVGLAMYWTKNPSTLWALVFLLGCSFGCPRCKSDREIRKKV